LRRAPSSSPAVLKVGFGVAIVAGQVVSIQVNSGQVKSREPFVRFKVVVVRQRD
jgi:hypothetical protein